MTDKFHANTVNIIKIKLVIILTIVFVLFRFSLLNKQNNIAKVKPASCDASGCKKSIKEIVIILMIAKTVSFDFIN